MTHPTQTGDCGGSNAEQLTRRKVLAKAGLGALAAGTLLAGSALAQTPRQRRAHPRIVRAIDEMQATREFLVNSPNQFGGYKAKAITAIEVAIVDLKLAMQYTGA